MIHTTRAVATDNIRFSKAAGVCALFRDSDGMVEGVIIRSHAS